MICNCRLIYEKKRIKKLFAEIKVKKIKKAVLKTM